MTISFLLSAFVFLCAAVAIVPLAKKGGLGSVLGYLIAGILIGPHSLGLIDNPEKALHFSEFGVVLMLFLIGMELNPRSLWAMRNPILGLGGLQVLMTTLVLSAGLSFFMNWAVALTIGLALSLSSTAMVLQIMNEKKLIKTSLGSKSFSVLLFQDIAVIPILAMVPIIAAYAPQEAAHPAASGGEAVAHATQAIIHLPAWLEPFKVIIVVGIIVLFGRYVLQHAFQYISESRMREIFTATSLLLVTGVSLLMMSLGLSAALGAFVAGVVLANSEYRHTLEADIAPFKGLLLGLFFISVGMSINFPLVFDNLQIVTASVLALVGIKLAILLALANMFRIHSPFNWTFGLILAQGGEFAFVIMQVARAEHVVDSELSSIIAAIVALSMLMTPLLMIINDRLIQKRLTQKGPAPSFDNIENEGHPVIIAGYGRFGQILGRLVSSQGYKTTILEEDPEQINSLRRFGNRVYFGDPSRLEMLSAAGAADAAALVIAVNDPERAIMITKIAKENFPHLKIFARARNRRHAYELNKAGADIIRRETFDSSLWLGRKVLEGLGMRSYHARNKAMRFMQHDHDILMHSFQFFEDEKELISFAKQSTEELEMILRDDRNKESHLMQNIGWGSNAVDDADILDRSQRKQQAKKDAS
jgi:monovalent cation:proton antiporter-2 (CPA2) family protein